MNANTTKSHKFIIWVINILCAKFDGKKSHEPAFLEKVISRYDWPECKKAIENKYNSLISNDILEIIIFFTTANIIIHQFILKLKKNWLGNILKYKSCWVTQAYQKQKSLLCSYVYISYEHYELEIFNVNESKKKN